MLALNNCLHSIVSLSNNPPLLFHPLVEQSWKNPFEIAYRQFLAPCLIASTVAITFLPLLALVWDVARKCALSEDWYLLCQ